MSKDIRKKSQLQVMSLLQNMSLYGRSWYWASRPFTLTASIVPVLVGSALAFQESSVDLKLFVLVLMGVILVQIGTNLVDEYTDESGPEGKEKLLARYKVISLGLLSSNGVRLGALSAFGIAGIIGVYLILVGGWPILVICLTSLTVAYFYSAGPRPLGKLAMGMPLVFLFMGPIIVLGAYYVQSKIFTLEAFFISMPVACLVTAILLANDLRDFEEDFASGKITVVTMFGRPVGKCIWILLVAAAFSWVIVLVILMGQTLLLLLSFLAFPISVKVMRIVWTSEDRRTLSVSLWESARLHWWLGVLLACGVGFGRFVAF